MLSVAEEDSVSANGAGAVTQINSAAVVVGYYSNVSYMVLLMVVAGDGVNVVERRCAVYWEVEEGNSNGKVEWDYLDVICIAAVVEQQNNIVVVADVEDPARHTGRVAGSLPALVYYPHRY